MALNLGPFVLQHPVARGGMAEVWRAVHPEAGHTVAVKVMIVEPAQQETFRAAFRTEIRAAATLSHRWLVPIYDFGEIPEAVAAASRGRLPEGAPYLVMEFAPDGSLSRRRGQLGWEALRSALLCVLEGLAHAHARGMIHCDLKPGNVLVHGDRVKLTDFGLARIGADDRPRGGGGTPTYMAPEQFGRRWRSVGPWTDLYGLGCLAWVLACGTAPFGDGQTPDATRERHLAGTPSPFAPRIPVPRGFEEWIRSLIRRAPADRVQRAADAAASLRRLDRPGAGGGIAPFHALVPPPAVPWIPGIGPRMFSIRQLPMVGRRAEREIAWELLREASARRDPRALVIRGPSGSGKTRLARWLAETADEVGAATVLWVTHTDPPSAGDGVREAALRAISGAGLGPEALIAHLGERGVSDPEGLGAALLSSRPVQEAPMVAWLEEQGWDRVILLVIDRASLAGQTLPLLRRLLERRACHLLAVLLVDDESLDRRPAEREEIARLAAQPIAATLLLGPFPRSEWSELLRECLPLEPELAARIEDRTAGDPALALPMLADWLERGRLVSTPRGYGLAPGEAPALPEELVARWSARIDGWVSGLEERAIALELVAVLGPEVPIARWRAACAAAGIGCPPVETLVDGGWVAPWADRRGFTLGPPPLREILEQRAEAAGRWVTLHRACAAIGVDDDDAPELARRARHLAIAGDPGAEAEFRRALAASGERDPRWTIALVCRWDELLPEDGRISAVRGRCEAWTAGALAARRCGRTATASRWIARARPPIEAHGWRDLEARLRRVEGELAADLGRPEEALGLLGSAASAAVEADELPLALSIRLSGALLRSALGDIEGAVAAFEEIARDAERAGQPVLAAQARVGLGAGHLAETERALAALERHGTRWDRAQTHHHLAEAYRRAGELERAESHYRSALALHRELGAWVGLCSELALHLIGLARGRSAAAEPELERILWIGRKDGRPLVEAAASAGLARIAASAGRWDRMAEHLAGLDARLSETRLVHADLAELTAEAGRLALEAGQGDLSERALRIARQQYAALGRASDRDRIALLLGSAVAS